MGTTAQPKISNGKPRTVHVCPFCGCTEGDIGHACPRCTLEDSPATRQATKQRIGPWYVLQKRNPAAPGMNLATLRSLIHKGLIKPTSIVRGPTTSQLWKLAGQTKGLSRELGLCYGCGADIDRETEICPECTRSQVPPTDDSVVDHHRSAPTTPTSPSAPHSVDSQHDEPATEPAHADRSEIVFTDGDLLTPKDLAKAFHLDYDPTAQPTQNKKCRIPRLKEIIFLAAGGFVLIIGATVFLTRSKPVVPQRRVPVVDTSINQNIQLATDRAVPTIAAVPATMPTTSPVATVEHAALHPADDPKSLWSSALDAEARGDFKSAIKLYERIESLPNSQWPVSLQTRLNLVRQELADGAH